MDDVLVQSAKQTAVQFRHQKVSKAFIPNGGTLTDFAVRGDYWPRSSLGLSAWVQREGWLFPVIQPNASKNVTAAIEISWEPHKWLGRRPVGSQP